MCDRVCVYVSELCARAYVSVWEGGLFVRASARVNVLFLWVSCSCIKISYRSALRTMMVADLRPCRFDVCKPAV